MSSDISDLNISDIEDNLFNYSYHSRYLTKLLNKNFDKEDPHYISTYGSFVGEVYENVIYELLLRYAVEEPSITSFVLKGPHQNGHKNEKNGLLIDIKDQIVYKSGYKDVSEFDGLFFSEFTKDGIETKELWFVESTIVKTTTSLKKRLKKKKALLQLIFPKYTIRALIILSQGVMGATTFPSYCTVWVTKQLEDTDLVTRLIDIKNQPKRDFKKVKSPKLIETKNIKIAIYKYFETLSWILKNTRSKKDVLVNFNFLNSQEVEQYFDICSKLYIGFIDVSEFKKLYPSFTLDGIDDNRVIVTIEKMKVGFELFYYAKLQKGKLKKIEVLEGNELKISDKDPKGFTASETKYMKYIWKHYHSFSSSNILNIKEECKVKKVKQKIETDEVKEETKEKREIYILSDKRVKGVNNLPTFKINFLPTSFDISSYDALVFTSKNGVLSIDSFNDEWKRIPSYAISYKTAQCIEKSGGILEYTGKSGHGNTFSKELIPLLKDRFTIFAVPSILIFRIL